MTEYDNNNRGALFTPKSDKLPCDLSGKAEIDGTDYYMDYYKSNGRSRGILVLREVDDSRIVHVAPLYPGSGSVVMYGQFVNSISERVTFNVFTNERKNERSPFLNISFQVKEGGDETPTRKTNTEEDMPF